MKRLVCSRCGFDFCICYLPYSPFYTKSIRPFGPMVEWENLETNVKIRHLETVITTMIAGKAPKSEIDKLIKEKNQWKSTEEIS